MSVPPKWENMLIVHQLPIYKRSARTALAGTHNPVGSDPRTGTGPFPKPRALVLPMVNFGQPKSDRLGHIDSADSDLMHHQFRLSLLQWNPGPARRNPTDIVSAVCGKFHAVILQEASDHVPHISDQLIAHTGNTDLAILLNKDTSEPDFMVLAFREDSTSKDTCCMFLLIVRGLLRRPSLPSTPTVTFCSVNIHNIVAKKRDASTDLPRRLLGYMHQLNGVPFPLLVTSSQTRSLRRLATRSCGVSADWTTRVVNARGSTSCPSAHVSGESTLTAATSTTTPSLASHPVIEELILPDFLISAPPTHQALTASCATKKA